MPFKFPEILCRPSICRIISLWDTHRWNSLINFWLSLLKETSSPWSCWEYPLALWPASDKSKSEIFDVSASASNNRWETWFFCHVLKKVHTCASTSGLSLYFGYGYDIISSSSTHELVDSLLGLVGSLCGLSGRDCLRCLYRVLYFYWQCLYWSLRYCQWCSFRVSIACMSRVWWLER